MYQGRCRLTLAEKFYGGGTSGGGAGTYYSTPESAMSAAQSQMGSGFDYKTFGQSLTKGFQSAGQSFGTQSSIPGISGGMNQAWLQDDPDLQAAIQRLYAMMQGGGGY